MGFVDVLAKQRSAAWNREGSGFGSRAINGLSWLALCVVLAFGSQATLSRTAVAQEVAPSVIAQFTTAIENREPVDQMTFVENDVRKVFFFTDLRGLNGRTVQHRWLYDAKVMAEVSFEVRGPRWRVWSSKELLPDWIGNWTVEVVTAEGEVIAAETFTYSAPGA